MLEWENLKPQLCPFPYTFCENVLKVDFWVHLCIIVSPLLSDRLHNWYLHIVDRQDNNKYCSFHLYDNRILPLYRPWIKELTWNQQFSYNLMLQMAKPNYFITLDILLFETSLHGRGTKRIIIAIYLKMICSRRFLPLRRTHQHTKTAVSGNHYTTSSG